MECNTEGGVIFDVGSLYARLQTLQDRRKPQGLRYQLVNILVMMVLAQICGEDTPSGIADWVKYRGEQIRAWLKLKHKSMPHHSTYRRISADIIEVEILVQIASELLSDKKYFGKQVLLSLDSDCGKWYRVHLVCEEQSTPDGRKHPFVV